MLSSQVDYYELLHVRPDAPAALIKACYRTLMQKLKLHPDLGGDVAIARQINEAYAVLSDPESRARYDAVRLSRGTESAVQSTTQATRSSHRPTANRVMWDARANLNQQKCLFCSFSHPYSSEPPANALCKCCGCPLAPVSEREALDRERRALNRLEIERHISYRTLSTESMTPALTSDLSLTGLKFESTADLIIDQLVQISSPFCQALARIAHASEIGGVVSPSTRRYGVEYLTLYFPTTSGALLSQSV